MAMTGEVLPLPSGLEKLSYILYLISYIYKLYFSPKKWYHG